MDSETKIWGSVKHLFDGPVAMSSLQVEAGSFCSLHRHLHRWNHFFVISGEITIVLYNGDMTVSRRVVLKAHQSYTVKPGMLHKFEVGESGRVVEVYWTEDGHSASIDDIERIKEGGRFW